MAFQIHELLSHSSNSYCIPNACQAFEKGGEYRDERRAYPVEQHTVWEEKLICKWPSSKQCFDCYGTMETRPLKPRADE